jgi:hypothetical protein
MSKRKDKERAEKGQAFRNPKEGGKICPFPMCTRLYTAEQGKPEACEKHREFILDYIFCLQHIVISPTPPPGVESKHLYIPKAGMADQAIKQAAAEADKISKTGGKKQ